MLYLSITKREFRWVIFLNIANYDQKDRINQNDKKTTLTITGLTIKKAGLA